ncbi:dentin sialophosphoprotein-like isoform X4 [Hibiscus syriacus]|uniref:Dentin sialophosphoprotein-like isoform X4 n=1 Tax=Hibiscus syriacus TaxID=106335 RepID=A0A6A3AFF1_HIBSY|nr:dentin sialophosphoprotein-like isoform X4 [Hibiscus syriacus]
MEASSLSMAGRLVLIKSVLSSLPIFYLAIFKIPAKICQKLNSLMANFLWGGGEEKKKMHWSTIGKVGVEVCPKKNLCGKSSYVLNIVLVVFLWMSISLPIRTLGFGEEESMRLGSGSAVDLLDKLNVIKLNELWRIACFGLVRARVCIPLKLARNLSTQWMRITLGGTNVFGKNHSLLGIKLALPTDPSSILISWPVVYWSPPPVDFFKFNVDGAVRPTPIILAELKAIKRGIDIFVSSEWVLKGRLIIESDCKLAVEWLKYQENKMSSLEKERQDFLSTIEALQEEKKVLHSKLKDAFCSGKSVEVIKNTTSKKDMSTSTEDLGFGVGSYQDADKLLQLLSFCNAFIAHMSLMLQTSSDTTSDDKELNISTDASTASLLPENGGLKVSSVYIPPDQLRMILNINSLISELTMEKEELTHALSSESSQSAKLKELNEELSRKLELQTQRLELLTAQSLASESILTKQPVSRIIHEITTPYADEGDEVPPFSRVSYFYSNVMIVGGGEGIRMDHEALSRRAIKTETQQAAFVLNPRNLGKDRSKLAYTFVLKQKLVNVDRATIDQQNPNVSLLKRGIRKALAIVGFHFRDQTLMGAITRC